jgi:hypothetical protein
VVEIERLAPYPLLQATTEFWMRKSFDGGLPHRGFTPNYLLECRSPHRAPRDGEAGHGVAIIPSALRVHAMRSDGCVSSTGRSP